MSELCKNKNIEHNTFFSKTAYFLLLYSYLNERGPISSVTKMKPFTIMAKMQAAVAVYSTAVVSRFKMSVSLC